MNIDCKVFGETLLETNYLKNNMDFFYKVRSLTDLIT